MEIPSPAATKSSHGELLNLKLGKQSTKGERARRVGCMARIVRNRIMAVKTSELSPMRDLLTKARNQQEDEVVNSVQCGKVRTFSACVLAPFL